MPFNVSVLKTTADCDAAIASATTEKTALAVEKSNLEHDKTGMAPVQTASEQKLKGVLLQETLVDTMLSSGITDEDTKQEYEKLKGHLLVRKNVLKERLDNNSGTAQALKELDIVQIDVQIKAIDQFITEVQAHKATL